jgi:hypothetical protein
VKHGAADERDKMLGAARQRRQDEVTLAREASTRAAIATRSTARDRLAAREPLAVVADVTIIAGVVLAGVATYVFGSADSQVGTDAAVAVAPDASPSASTEDGLALPPPDCTDPELVAHYVMDEGTGDVVHDCSRNHLDGRFAGNPTALGWEKRNDGGSLEIVGTGAYVDLGNSTAFDLHDQLTIAAFVRRRANSNDFVSLLWRFPSWELSLFGNGGGVMAKVGPDGPQTGVPAFPLDVWQHVAMVYEPQIRLEAFLNGVSVSKLEPFGGLPAPGGEQAAGQVKIGAVNDAVSWTGEIDDVHVYARALSAAEIQALAAR